MEARTTQLRGKGRETHATERTTASIAETRGRTSPGGSRKAILITTIAAVLASVGGVGPAAADTLVTNLGSFVSGDLPLGSTDYVQSFTTGSNPTGYLIESISIDFSQGTSDPNKTVYVYLHEDNGSGRPNHRQGGQVATLTKNGRNFAPPDTGVNKYTIWEANGCCPKQGSAHLDANSRYWVYIWSGEANAAKLETTVVKTQTGAAGWTIGDAAMSKPSVGNSDGIYTYTPLLDVLQIKVEGRRAGVPNLVIQPRTTATEGVDEAAEFDVRLRPASPTTVTVDYATENQTAFAPADFEATAGTLTFQPGDTVKKVLVPIVDDSDGTESDEEFNLKLSNATNATITNATGVARIVNNPSLEVSINDVTVTEGINATADFVISLNQTSSSTVRMLVVTDDTRHDASGGIDYRSKQDFVEFQPGELEKTFSVQIIDDSIDDSGEQFLVIITLPDNSPAVFADDGIGIGTILNDEVLTASLRNVPQDHDGSNFSFNVAFTAEVGISPQHMRDWAFKWENGKVTAAERVDGRYDYWKITVDPDGNKDVTMTVKGNRNCGAVGAICTKEEQPAKLTNSPSATIVYSADDTTGTSTPSVSIAGGSGTEGTNTSISFTVTLDEAATDTVTVDYATSDGTADGGDDYTAKSGTLTFDAGTTSKTISVSIADDTDNESDETFTVTLSNASGADLGTATATGTIRNRTVVVETTPTVSIAGGSGKEGDDDEIDFTVTLDEAASGTVTVDYTTSDGTADAGDDYTAKSGTLTFSAGTTSKTISVSIADDIENESDETFTVTLSNASGAILGTSTATGTIRNRRVEPLTASFSGMPTEHDGSSFTFDLHFSENVGGGLQRTDPRRRVHASTKADVTHAQRKNPQSADKNKSWTITVEPDGNETLEHHAPGDHQLQQQPGHLHRRRAEAQPLDVGDGRRPGRHLGGRRRSRGGRRRGPGLPGGAHSCCEQRPDGRLLDVGRHRNGRRRLHVDLRNADDRRGQLVGHGRGVRHRRRTQRGQRDVHADAVERLERRR